MSYSRNLRTARYADGSIGAPAIFGKASVTRGTIGMGHSIGSILFRIWCFVQSPLFALFFWRASRRPPERSDELNLRDR